MSRTALVVGGTGPTGPHVVKGLQGRGFEVTILHRGTHEIPELADLEHIHADPHFHESIDDAVGSRRFDVVIGTYGRLRHVAAAFAGRCDEFIGVSGVPAYEGYHEPETCWPHGMAIDVAEDAVVERQAVDGESAATRFSRSIHDGERVVMGLHDEGAFSASLFRYPSIYGPRQLYPRDWSIIRRVLDGRRSIILADSGLTLLTRCSAPNAAQFLLSAVDRPEAAAGETFNVADLQQYSLRQWTQMVSRFAGRELAIESLPFELAGPGRDLFPVPHHDHGLVSTHKARVLLGYQEAVPAATALQASVEWYIDNPPSRKTLDAMIDRFDYEAEDRTVEQFRRATADLLAAQAQAQTAEHPYAHPTTAGATDHRGR